MSINTAGIYILYFETDDGQYYIGKSVDISSRYRHHCRSLEIGSHKNYILAGKYRELKQLPKVYVLEASQDLESLFDREIFWIEKFNTFYDGMNLTKGGEGTGVGEEAPGALYTEKIYVEILKELGDINNTISAVSKKLRVSEYVVSNISTGTSHTYLRITHPELWENMLALLGNRTTKKYSNDTYIQIVQLLAKEYSLIEVSEVLEVAYYIVSNISRGATHQYLQGTIPKEYSKMREFAKLGYRARKFNSLIYIEVLELLAYTDLKYLEIAKRTGTTLAVVTSISTGGAHRYLKEEFPEAYAVVESKRGTRDHEDELPRKSERHFLHDIEVYVNIMNELANTSKKLNVIAKENGVDQGVVEDISRGSTHKYLSVEYPEVYSKMLAKKGSRRAGSQSGLAYPDVKDPIGTIHSNIANAKAFALEHNLHPGHFGDLLRGTAKSHKGWTLA